MSNTSSYHVYIVECSDGSYYTGIARDVALRIRQHNGLVVGGGKYTRSRRPVLLVYTEKCHSKSEALKREYEVKNLSREKKKHLIQGISDNVLIVGTKNIC